MDPVRRRRGLGVLASEGDGAREDDYAFFAGAAADDDDDDNDQRRRRLPIARVLVGMLNSDRGRRSVLAALVLLFFMVTTTISHRRAKAPEVNFEEKPDKKVFMERHGSLLDEIKVTMDLVENEELVQNTAESRFDDLKVTATSPPTFPDTVGDSAEGLEPEEDDKHKLKLRGSPTGLTTDSMHHNDIEPNTNPDIEETFKLTFVAGTRHDDPRRYLVGQRQKFRCPGSDPRTAQTLLHFQINDGYCDCPESGFDEPGTPACSGLALASYEPLFYCGHRDGRSLPSSRVWDGVCDCCDGVDEGPGQRYCKDTCDQRQYDREQEERRIAEAKMRGKDLLLQNPELQSLLDSTQSENELIVLTDHLLELVLGTPGHTALSFDDGQSTYEISSTLKRSFRQYSGHRARGRGISLGNVRSWDPVHKRLLLNSGDRCPNGISRTAEIILECAESGSASTIVRVSEPSTCNYLGVVKSAFGCALQS